MLGLMTCAPGIDPFTGLPLFTPAACAPPKPEPKPDPKPAPDAYKMPSNNLVVRVRDYYSGNILFVTPCRNGFVPNFKVSFEFDEVRRLAFELLSLETPHTRTDALDDGVQKLAGCDAYVSRMDEFNGLMNMKSAIQCGSSDALLQSQLKFRIKYHVVGDMSAAEEAAFGTNAHDADTCSMTSSWSVSSSSDDASVCYTAIKAAAAAATLDTCSMTTSADGSMYEDVDDDNNSVTCSLTSSASTQDHPAWWWSSNDSDAASTCSLTSSDSTGIVPLSGTLTIDSVVLSARDMMPWVDSVVGNVGTLVADGSYDGISAIFESLSEALKMSSVKVTKLYKACEKLRSSEATQISRLKTKCNDIQQKLKDQKASHLNLESSLTMVACASAVGKREWYYKQWTLDCTGKWPVAPAWVYDVDVPMPTHIMMHFMKC